MFVSRIKKKGKSSGLHYINNHNNTHLWTVFNVMSFGKTKMTKICGWWPLVWLSI